MSNTHATREGWLSAAADAMAPLFADVGITLPENIRYAVAFPSAGGKGKAIGECWQAAASEDNHYQIIIRADRAEPVDVLGILIHELLHACLPAGTGHGKPFAKAARALGLTGKMTATVPDIALLSRLTVIAEGLGPFPHGRLDYLAAADDKPKKQAARMLKVECEQCAYTLRLTRKWAEVALPICPADDAHGRMTCEALEEAED